MSVRFVPPDRRCVADLGRTWSASPKKTGSAKDATSVAAVQSHDIPLPPAMIFGYIPFCVVVVVEARPFDLCHGECATMIVIGLIVSAFGIGFLCWLLFTLAVYALPLFAGMTAGLAAYHSGAGVLGALVVGSLRARSRSSRAKPPLQPSNRRSYAS